MAKQGSHVMDLMHRRKSQQELMNEKHRLLKKTDSNQYANKINMDITNAINTNHRENNRQNMIPNYRQEQRNQIEDHRLEPLSRSKLEKSSNKSRHALPAKRILPQKMEPKLVRFDSDYMDQVKRNSTLKGEASFEDEPKPLPKKSRLSLPTSPSKSSGSNRLGAFGSLMAIEKMQKEALEKSMELDEMVEEQMKEHEERRTLMSKQKSRDSLHNDIQKFYRSKISNDPQQNQQKQLTIEPQNSIEVSRDAQNALLKSQETWQRIQNTKSNYDKLIRIQEQQSDPETATQAMKNLWNTQQKEDAKAKRNMKKTSFR
uniref:Uncharacterized protein n=1 Tax=Lepeophtheirus salmonis TaxID=72036 RepID=A0A0K2SWF3_LEPSM